MAGTLYNSTSLDRDGRQLVLNDSISASFFYDCSSESWDKSGPGSSWSEELSLPNDIFDANSVSIDRWDIIDSTNGALGGISQSNSLIVEVVKSGGTLGISSENKWKLSGDFEVIVYIDWDSYYNEYRSITSSFLRVSRDGSNSVRVGLYFDGTSFSVLSEKAVARNLLFFDWLDNGNPYELNSFSDVEDFQFLKIVRESGVITCYVSDGSSDTQVGDSLDDSVFSEDLYVDIGVEAKEYNTLKTTFTKFIVSGSVDRELSFFSSVRGVSTRFPDRVILVLEESSLSVIDADEETLWMRFLIGESCALKEAPNLFAQNGVIYCTSNTGLLAFDFKKDKIFKYKDSSVFSAVEPLALRNSVTSFHTYLSNTGSIRSNVGTVVAGIELSGKEYIAWGSDVGVSVFTPLSSGVAFTLDGALPTNKIKFSNDGSLYWSGYDPTQNYGSVSFKAGISDIEYSSSPSFSRDSYYDDTTELSIFGRRIQDIDVVNSAGVNLVAVGTDIGITFLPKAPAALRGGVFSYGVTSVESNPIQDPIFSEYLPKYWKVEYNGFYRDFFVERSTAFSTSGTHSLSLRFTNPPGYFPIGTYGGVYQDVDLTGVGTLYFDSKITPPTVSAGTRWEAQFIVGDTVVKTYSDEDAPFTRIADSIDVSDFSGVQRFRIRLVVKSESNFGFNGRVLYVDNFRTYLEDPSYRILPQGESSVKELLLQYDGSGHKLYFATNGGYGALDLDEHVLDYFNEIVGAVEGAVINAGDFSRIIVDED